jgi:GAF domain-containing protein
MSAQSRSPLQDVVAALTRYFVGDQPLGATLQRVAELTVQALPQTAHIGITMMVDGRPGTAIFTDPEVVEIEQAQYRSGDGPCLDAFRDGKSHVIADTRDPGSWVEFRESAFRHGVLSTLSMPLIAHLGPVGALNLYSPTVDAYTQDDIDIGESFASQAGFVLVNAQAYWDAKTLSENLEQAMRSRATIEQAKGIIMAATHCAPERAIELLIEQSQHENIKLRELAGEIVRKTAVPGR